jgi:lysophospholipase L1-like esterase
MRSTGFARKRSMVLAIGVVPLLAVFGGWFTPVRVSTARILPQQTSPLREVRRVIFLGDSITHDGRYVAYLETYLRLCDPKLSCEFLNLALPSETLSGLSEPGHAAGQFPRPDLHERLDRVLDQTKPNLIVACYGMNDGIFYPFGEERFAKFQAGLRYLRERAGARGAKVIHLTPPVFDPLPIKSRTLAAGRSEYRQPYEGYDEVLDRYSDWLLAQRKDGWDVIDVHGPMKQFLTAQRTKDAVFRLADDGVHINGRGHWLITEAILSHWKFAQRAGHDPTSGERTLASFPKGTELLRLVTERQQIMRDSWLTAIGHKRPGLRRGMPLDEAQREAATIDGKIELLLQESSPSGSRT